MLKIGTNYEDIFSRNAAQWHDERPVCTARAAFYRSGKYRRGLYRFERLAWHSQDHRTGQRQRNRSIIEYLPKR